LDLFGPKLLKDNAMTFSIWLSLFAVCLLGAMSPGPSLAMVLKHSLAGGKLNGLAAAWAHAIGIGVYACLSLLGLSIILHKAEWLFLTISYAGAAYLAYLGWKAIRSPGSTTSHLGNREAVPLLTSAREGLMISILNPKIALFFTALFSQFVDVGHELFSQIVVVITPMAVDGLWYTAITLLVSNRVVFSKMKAKSQLIDRLSGVVLLGLACRVVVSL
jgi:threonine/homoserine/homoserine lactone efflux protein